MCTFELDPQSPLIKGHSYTPDSCIYSFLPKIWTLVIHIYLHTLSSFRSLRTPIKTS